MRNLILLIALVLIAAAALMWIRYVPATAPEPVLFSPVQVDAFSDPGTLTDAWADIDGDGDPDRFVGFNGSPARM